MRVLLAIALLSLLACSHALEIASSVQPHPRPDLRGVKDGALPAIRGVLSQNGANYILNSALPIIFAKVKGLQIPEIDGSSSVPILGDIDYHLSNIQINQLAYQASGIALQSEITASITGVTVAITADWGYRQSSWPHISSDGSADISISNSGLTISLKTGVTANGSPQLYVDAVNADFEDLSISVHGSILSWLYDLIFDVAKNKIKSAAAQIVATELTNLINVMADQALAGIMLDVPLGNTTQLDMTLVDAPSLPNSNFEVDLKGQFENKTNPQPAPLPHVTFPPTLPIQHVLLQIDQYLFGSGLWLAYSSGMLSTVVTAATLPPQVPFTLNTSTFAEIVPELAKAFPNAAIEWKINALSCPTANITGPGVEVGAAFAMAWYAADPSGNFQPAFEVELDLGALVSLTLNATAIGGNMSFTSFNMELMSSSIGKVDLTTLNIFFSAIVEGPILQLINQAIGGGIPLPTIAGIQLVDPHLIYHEDYAEMNADLHIVPPASVVAALDAVVAARPAHPGRVRYNAKPHHHSARLN